MVMGMGFPAYRGGLIFWADLVGAGARALGVRAVAAAAGQSLRREGSRAPVACFTVPPCVLTCSACQPARDAQPLASPSQPPEHIRARLAGWAAQFEGSGLAGFFRPCAYLEDCARRGAKLSAGRAAPSKM